MSAEIILFRLERGLRKEKSLSDGDLRALRAAAADLPDAVVVDTGRTDQGIMWATLRRLGEDTSAVLLRDGTRIAVVDPAGEPQGAFRAPAAAIAAAARVVREWAGEEGEQEPAANDQRDRAANDQ